MRELLYIHVDIIARMRLVLVLCNKFTYNPPKPENPHTFRLLRTEDREKFEIITVLAQNLTKRSSRASSFSNLERHNSE